MKFIEGDLVELITNEQVNGEIENWAELDDLPLNTPLTVVGVEENPEGQWIDLSGYIYSHPSVKFKLFNPIYEIY